MEEECGIPVDYFDFVYSIYAIGWTTDPENTFCRIASYLKIEELSKCLSKIRDYVSKKSSAYDKRDILQDIKKLKQSHSNSISDEFKVFLDNAERLLSDEH